MASEPIPLRSQVSASIPVSLRHLLSHHSDAVRLLRTFAVQGDDDDVRNAFASQANDLEQQLLTLQSRLDSPGEGNVSKSFSELSWTPTQLADFSFKESVVEEQTLRHILIAYTASTGLVALSEATATLANSASEHETEALVRKVQVQDRRAVETYWHFLGTRTKLAYNMLTISEIDPAVETKVADDKLLS